MTARGLAAAAVLVVTATGVVAGASGAVAGEGPTAGAAATKTVKVADNFYSPSRLTVKPRTTIRWRWSNRNSDSHDVLLNKGPRGVRRFHSDPAATFFSFKRKLRKTGTYRIVCTFHENMKMRVTVKR